MELKAIDNVILFDVEKMADLEDRAVALITPPSPPSPPPPPSFSSPSPPPSPAGNIYRIITKNTIEEEILERQLMKKAVERAPINIEVLFSSEFWISYYLPLSPPSPAAPLLFLSSFSFSVLLSFSFSSFPSG